MITLELTKYEALIVADLVSAATGEARLDAPATQAARRVHRKIEEHIDVNQNVEPDHE